jgi:putative lipoprotein
MPMRYSVRSVVVACVAAGVVGCGSAKEEPAPEQDVVPAPPGAGDLDLAGTAWRLVRFEGGDGTVLTPDDRSKYTLTFEPGGRLAARVDCNRGSGTWRSSSPTLELGPLALTRAMCPPESLHDRIVKHLPYVRTYLVRDDHLFLSLMADAGIYELEPLTERGANLGGIVRGTAIWRERMALPAGAALEATVEDVSPADAPADVVGRVRLEDPGNPPVRFQIPYDPALVDPARRYTVRARIVSGDRSLLATDKAYPVLGADGPHEVELVLRGAGAQAVVDQPLEGPRWRLTHVDDEAVRRDPGQAEAYLTFDPASLRVSGSGGCNHIGGTYRGNGESLELSRMVGTLMACEKGMETERAFLQALERVRGWKIRRDVLELTGAKGEVVARFEAGG